MNQRQPTGLNESLATSTKGAGIAFLGARVGMGLAFLSRVIVARIGTEAINSFFDLPDLHLFT